MNRKLPVLSTLTGILIILILIAPVIWAFNVSVGEVGAAPSNDPNWLPLDWHWGNYIEIFRIVPLASYAMNSIMVVVAAVPLAFITSLLMGFSMSQMTGRGRRVFLLGTIALLLVPDASLWIARYQVNSWLGLTDRLWALIAPAVAGGSPLFVLIFFWSFHRVPQRVYESAMLDGANLWQVLWHIGLPLVKPGALAVTVLSFVQFWNDFSSPVVFISNPNKYTLPIGLALIKQLDVTNWPLLMAASLVMTAPPIFIFLMSQNKFLPELLDFPNKISQKS